MSQRLVREPLQSAVDQSDVAGAIARYASGICTLNELYYWLTDNVQAVEESADTHELSDRAWILISEFDLGHRSEDSVRAELSALLAAA